VSLFASAAPVPSSAVAARAQPVSSLAHLFRAVRLTQLFQFVGRDIVVGREPEPEPEPICRYNCIREAEPELGPS
jgi:hypothetical protein